MATGTAAGRVTHGQGPKTRQTASHAPSSPPRCSKPLARLVTLSATSVIASQLQTLEDCSMISKKFRELRIWARPHHKEAESGWLQQHKICALGQTTDLFRAASSQMTQIQKTHLNRSRKDPKGPHSLLGLFTTSLSMMLTLRPSTEPLACYLTK